MRYANNEIDDISVPYLLQLTRKIYILLFSFSFYFRCWILYYNYCIYIIYIYIYFYKNIYIFVAYILTTTSCTPPHIDWHHTHTTISGTYNHYIIKQSVTLFCHYPIRKTHLILTSLHTHLTVQHLTRYTPPFYHKHTPCSP